MVFADFAHYTREVNKSSYILFTNKMSIVGFTRYLLNLKIRSKT